MPSGGFYSTGLIFNLYLCRVGLTFTLLRDFFMFSILIPTWNNLEMLQLCVESIRLHSTYEHQIALHINEGSDGTIAWAQAEGLDFTVSAENIGVCKAVNLAFGKAKREYIVYMNDDMYVLPGWDSALLFEIQGFPSHCFMASATMIEPVERNHKNVAIVRDYGNSVANFQQKKLMSEWQELPFRDWHGSSWPPLLVHRDYWNMVGGFSIEFSPGMYSDPDFAMKMWMAGCRIFKGVSDSRVYHFQSRSTNRVKKNNGRLQFMKKWGVSASAFYRYYLKMGDWYEGALKEPEKSLTLNLHRWKARFYGMINNE